MGMTDLCGTILQDMIKKVLNILCGSTEEVAMNSACGYGHND